MRQENQFQTREQDKTPEELSEVEISDKVLKVMIVEIKKIRIKMDDTVSSLTKRRYKEEPNRVEDYSN